MAEYESPLAGTASQRARSRTPPGTTAQVAREARDQRANDSDPFDTADLSDETASIEVRPADGPPEPTPAHGQRIAVTRSYFSGKRIGDYLIGHALGQGSMGMVFEATDRRLDRKVAFKLIRSGEGASERDIARFRREVHAVAKLQHPAIVPVHDVGQIGDLHFFTMDMVDGTTLTKWLRRQKPPLRERIKVLAVVADAIEHAHQRGVIHRDIKSGNIMVSRDGRPFVMDFGLAAKSDGSTQLTASGVAVGTPAYMSPEQAMGQSNAIDHRCDVWSLGVVLFECLTETQPFTGTTVLEVLNAVATCAPPHPCRLDPTIPRPLARITLNCLQRDPAQRYQTAQAFADDLRRWLNDEPVSARSDFRWANTLTSLLRHKSLLFGLAAGVAIGILMALLMAN